MQRQTQAIEEADLIPGLADDVAMECLLRVAGSSHPHMQAVCRRWERVIKSPEFYEERRRAGTLSPYICMVQAFPEPTCSMEADKDMAMPGFGLSMFDPKQGSWEWLPQIPDFPQGLPLFSQCLALEAKLFVVGGWNPSTYEAMTSIYIFNFCTRQWKRGRDMLEARSFFGCGVLNGQILVAGGHDEDKNALATAEVYLPEEDRWERLPQMSEERDECFGVVLNAKFYAISGYATEMQGQFVRSTDVYDPATGCWIRTEEFLMADIFPSAYTVAGGQLYAFRRQELLLYNCEDGTWESIDCLPYDGKVAACSAAGGDKLVISGLTASQKGHSWMHLYKPNRKHGAGHGQWQLLQDTVKFRGVVTASCTVKI
ncbi:hypothetical protein O6H91_04G128500 [Diphasiastrum complanatum]|uniref:Uncharacterized protein n=1 Tax=Diphasiastrum complanatum TaxID=34168 RepID=A0ACC2E1D4_DIPCM|nr:hypothetical protein O6H91_Y338500 [Diphasiastrum complanatum]KAJ7284307.1 hypothetical protein O6H91_Y338500 [Diphasiastrum complanatum]KAJ7284308.1 hypothetical protein O6H91_Y338500 [Diphasiastrum complanatum]KAJ7560414.1 hypothetical protein O6H91_04G128500 [Diphasiastrum complanatum]